MTLLYAVSLIQPTPCPLRRRGKGWARHNVSEMQGLLSFRRRVAAHGAPPPLPPSPQTGRGVGGRGEKYATPHLRLPPSHKGRRRRALRRGKLRHAAVMGIGIICSHPHSSRLAPCHLPLPEEGEGFLSPLLPPPFFFGAQKRRATSYARYCPTGALKGGRGQGGRTPHSAPPSAARARAPHSEAPQGAERILCPQIRSPPSGVRNEVTDIRQAPRKRGGGIQIA